MLLQKNNNECMFGPNITQEYINVCLDHISLIVYGHVVSRNILSSCPLESYYIKRCPGRLQTTIIDQHPVHAISNFDA